MPDLFSAVTEELARRRTPPSTSPRETPSLDAHHGRFRPGEILAGRYRIVERLGKGGMGEVYHADDLMLDQPVALKFLPPGLQHDKDRNARFRREVRLARQVSHPNVCRVYDIDEAGGVSFLSMEYIRGEDLSSLLRRIGRLPTDKAVEIARQICIGLAAAHEKGVLHRDLKPANVMIDEHGKARISDFGVAAALETTDRDEIRCGTPGYMAPEQWEGREVTVRSDLYSLGVLLYELFTGKPAFSASSPQELLLLQKDSSPKPPSSLVDDLDPAVERVILRCLEKDPRKRSSSALSVAAALPGGDPLAAALAAGETPSPQLIADAGETGALRPAIAWACLSSLLALLLLVVGMSSRTQLSGIVPLPKSPQVLAERAREVASRLGYSDPAQDSAFGFSYDRGYVDYVAARDDSPGRWDVLSGGEPAVIRFWYRQSPRHLVPHRLTEFFAQEFDPPALVTGMVSVELDPEGRLRGFEAVPPELLVPEPSRAVSDLDWSLPFTEAGFDLPRFTPAAPAWTPAVFADEIAAWEGTYPGAEDIPIRVEAAAFGGKPVAFRIVEPWTKATRMEAAGRRWVRPSDVIRANWASLVHIAFNVVAIVAVALLAYRNLRLRRGDRRGALRLALYMTSLILLHWLFGGHHVPERSELEIFYGGLYRAFFTCGLTWLFYMAVEPYARRLWPQMMVSWMRVLDGRFRDPLVGRGFLLGCLVGVVLHLYRQTYLLAPGWFGFMPPRPDWFHHPLELVTMRGMRHALSALFVVQHNILISTLFVVALLLLTRFIVRKTWLAAGLCWLLLTAVYDANAPYLPGLQWGPWEALFLFCLLHFGLVSAFVAFFVDDALFAFPLTLDSSSWYAGTTVLALVAVAALAVYGFKVSLAGRPAFRDLLAED